jgi:PTH2 family peptidyl-tRNA hydrolase
MKQVILVRRDLKMGIGKASAQCSHASVEAVLKSNESKVLNWQLEGSKKVILKVDSLAELKKYESQAKKAKLKTALIQDAARTFFKKPTITCLAIGPDEEEKIDRITGKLKML